jgi:hypothetical protein
MSIASENLEKGGGRIEEDAKQSGDHLCDAARPTMPSELGIE